MANCLDQHYAQVQQRKFPRSLAKSGTFAAFINVSATSEKLHSICNIFLLKVLATLATSFLKHCYICNISRALQHLQRFENSATPATFAICLKVSVIIATPQMAPQHPQQHEGTENFATFKGCATVCRLCNTCKALEVLFIEALQHSQHFKGIATLQHFNDLFNICNIFNNPQHPGLNLRFFNFFFLIKIAIIPKNHSYPNIPVTL